VTDDEDLAAVKHALAAMNSTLPPIHEMVETVASWIDLVADRLTSEYAHEKLQAYWAAEIGRGALSAMGVIEAAERGNGDADRAIRMVIADAIHGNRYDGLPPEVRGYHLKVLLRDEPGNSQAGRSYNDSYSRDLTISMLIACVVVHWWPLLKATRNPASKKPSAATVITLALKKRGVTLTEKRVNTIYGDFAKIVPRLYSANPTIS
jgi:hypothetical protein